MGKIILFTNVKGGVGKTTLCSVFATFLSQSGRPVAVVDADIQQSISGHRRMDLEERPDAAIPWPVQTLVGMSTEEVANAMVNLRHLSCDVLIDCPGNIIDPNLKAIYTNADIAVIPIHYDKDTLNASLDFIQMFKAKFNARMFFVPNGISGIDENREKVRLLRDKAKAILEPYGILTARIKRTSVVADYDTLLPLTSYQRNAVKFSFEPIIKELQKGGVD